MARRDHTKESQARCWVERIITRRTRPFFHTQFRCVSDCSKKKEQNIRNPQKKQGRRRRLYGSRDDGKSRGPLRWNPRRPRISCRSTTTQNRRVHEGRTGGSHHPEVGDATTRIHNTTHPTPSWEEEDDRTRRRQAVCRPFVIPRVGGCSSLGRENHNRRHTHRVARACQ